MYDDELAREQKRAWWARVKDERNAERRRRYREDAAYRKAQQQRVVERRTRLRQEAEKTMNELKDTNLPKPRARRPMRPRTMPVEIDGVRLEVTMYTTGALAVALDRTSQSLRLWERQGILPEALYRDDRSRRLYTEDQVRGIVSVFEQHADEKLLSWADSIIPQELAALWESLSGGVSVARLAKAKKENSK